MEVVTGAMNTLVPKLGDLLKEEYNLQKGVKDEIMFLIAELESMQAALLTVSEAPIDQPPDIQVKLWARDVRELSYDIEDCIDKFMVRVDAHAPNSGASLTGVIMGFIDKCRNLLTKAMIRHKIGAEVRDIKSRIEEVNERRKRYKVDNVAAKPTVTTVDSLRLAALYKKVTELVGTEERSDGLVKRLMEGDEASKQQLKIVSIVGFGGLGKTTLANVVYKKLKVQFDCWAFVSVSLNPNMEKFFKNMLHQLGKHNYEATLGEQELIRELREFLENKRYLIVIDDIWSNSTWERIKYALIENERGSRIITTTRILDVAEHSGGVYQLEPLSPADSKTLFYKRIFGNEDKCPPSQLAEVSKNILKKCGGVPLAIITIASMLAGKEERENTLTYWSKVYRSMGSGLEDSLHAQDMRRILSISYYDLPPHLKTCLLYLSLYPEDYEISKDDLIWKWVGEGFVHEKQGKGLYEVGEHFFDELINKSMIQPIHIFNDKATYCRVHDMVLDLITSLSNEEHFLTTLGDQQAISQPSRMRRLSLQTSTEEHVNQLATMSLTHVRSLTLFQQAFNLLPALSSFPALRALDLSGCMQVDNHHCKLVCNLIHLRYLWLRETSITEIPKEVGNLQFLRVLDIGLTAIKTLPLTFIELRQLVYLRVDHRIRLPYGFGGLKCLEELPCIDIRSLTMLNDLGRLTKLRCVHISFDEWDESYRGHFLQCLHDLVSLETLCIYGCGDLASLCDKLSLGSQHLQCIAMPSDFIYAVPRWMTELSSLSCLYISLETLGVEDLQVLGAIPSLSYLWLRVKQPTQGRDERLAIHNGDQFWCLSSFEFRGQTTEVVFAQGAMQKLRTLELEFGVRETLDQFGDFNLGLENLSSLERVSVHMAVWGTKPGEVEAAKAAIRKALDMNPNNPTLEFQTFQR